MWDRLFGRGKQDQSAEPTCAVCGRTLLPGEWAQTIVHDDGSEEIVCSLCSQAQGYAESPQQPYDHGVPAADQWPAVPAHDQTAGQTAASAASQPAVPSAAAYAAADAYAPVAHPVDELDEPTDAYVIPPESYDPPAEAYGPPAEAQATAATGSADAQPYADPYASSATTESAQHLVSDHEDSDAFWRALKDRDAEIARLQAEILRLEAERRELDSQLAAARGGQVAPEPEATAAAAAAAAAAWQPEATAAPATGQPPAEVAAETPWPTHISPGITDEWASPPPLDTGAAAEALASQQPEPAGTPTYDAIPPLQPTAEAVASEPDASAPSGSEDASPKAPPAPVTDMPGAGDAVGGPPPAYGPESPQVAAAPAVPDAVVDMPTQPIEIVVPGQPDAPAQEWCPVCDTADIPGAEVQAVLEASEQGTIQMPAAVAPAMGQITFEEQPEPPDMDLLQRGADLFNVSSMPQKVAETNELLGLPTVNLAAEGKVMTAVFMWSMAWYQYSVDLDGGDVKLDERGYDERAELRANGIVRSDGTIQLAPVPTRRPVVQAPPPEPPPQPESSPADAPTDAQPVDPGKGEFISKSLRGQRTDDEAVAWDEMAARDFDWGR